MSRFVKSLQHNQDAIDTFEQIKQMYDFIKDQKEYRLTASQLTVTDDNYHIVDKEFPLIAEFRKKYKMSNFMLIIELTESWYQALPHSHNIKDTTGSIFWPIVYSDYAATGFYLPPEETIINRNVPGTYFKLTECKWDEPAEIVKLKHPTVFHMNHFHKPIALKDHPDNANRVVCNWEAATGVSFEELSELTN